MCSTNYHKFYTYDTAETRALDVLLKLQVTHDQAQGSPKLSLAAGNCKFDRSNACTLVSFENAASCMQMQDAMLARFAR